MAVMSLMNMPIDERLDCLQELLSCTGKMYSWTYDADGNVLKTNCADRVLDTVFTSNGGMDAILEHAARSRMPLILSLRYGLSWSAAFEAEEEKIVRIHVFGPIATSEISYDGIRRATQKNSKVKLRWQNKFFHMLERVPIVSTIDFFRYTLMLHYCITGEKLTNADIEFCEPDAGRKHRDQEIRKDRKNTYMVEQALMRMVTEGDLNYKEVLHNAASASRGVRTSEMGSLEQVRVSQIVFISLCTRAAIQGGISPEIAYTRGDAYIQDILDCKSIADAAHIGHTMYDDFIRLVHKGRANPEYSPQIQSCCEYIELHAEDKLTLAEIADHIGYVDYYLSRKFKAETGVNINDYIKKVKVERAKTFLIGTEMSIQDICDRLSFGSRSFFAETFKEIAGLPPAAYREQHKKI